MKALRFAPLAVLLSLSAGLYAGEIRTWDREVSPGVTFRMERVEDLNINVYGVRLKRGKAIQKPVLARGVIYDSTPTNGRDTISKIVANQNAAGGINGDFFQFGDDPGGDPMGALVIASELISNPGTNRRYASFGWDRSGRYVPVNLKFEAAVTLPDGKRVKVSDVNTRCAGKKVIFGTSTMNQVYGDAPFTLVRCKSAISVLKPTMDAEFVVTAVEQVEKRADIGKGEFVFAAPEAQSSPFKKLATGDRLRFRCETSGADWKKVVSVMGGGPVVVAEGRPQHFLHIDDFAETKHPRSAVGVTPSGDFWYLVVDGRQAQSTGISLDDLGQLMARWGCVEAMNLDGGGSSAINLLGLTLNKPAGGVERQVANAVVWDFVRPVQGPEFQILGPEKASVKQDLKLTLSSDAPNAIWTAQGPGWIGQDGVLHTLAAGEIKISVLLNGRIVKKSVMVEGT